MMKRKMIISGLIASILSVPVLVSAQSINSNANGEKVKSEQGYIRGNKAFGQSQGKGLGKGRNGEQRGKGNCENLPNITDEAKKELETLRDETRALRENNQNTMQEFRNAVNNKDKEATNTASQKLTQQINTRISLLQKKVDLLNKYIK